MDNYAHRTCESFFPRNARGYGGDSAKRREITGGGGVRAVVSSEAKFYGNAELFIGDAYAYNYMYEASVFAFGNVPFTMEGWFKFKSKTRNSTTSRTPQILGNYDPQGAVAANHWRMYFDHASYANKISFWVGNISTGVPILQSETLSFDTWYHVAVCRDQTNFYLFVNGVKVSTYGPSTANLNSATMTATESRFVIGNYNLTQLYDNLHQTFWLNDFRLTRGLCRYNDTFTPPGELSSIGHYMVEPGTKVRTTFLPLNEFSNASTQNWGNSSAVPVLNGSITASETQSKFSYGRSLYFNGISQYLSFVANAEFSNAGLINPSFTWEAWIFPTPASGWPNVTAMSLFDFRSTETGEGQFYIAIDGVLSYWNGTNNYRASIALTANTWSHVVCQWDGTQNVLRFFIDGVEVGVTYIAAGITMAASPTCRIGVNYTGADYFFGYMQDAKITRGKAVYSRKFTPPTAEYDDTDPYWSNVVLNMKMNGAEDGTTFTEDKGKAVTLVGAGVKTKEKEKMLGTAAATFTTAGSYLYLDDSDDWNFDAGDFTIEGYFNFNPLCLNGAGTGQVTAHLLSRVNDTTGTGDWGLLYRNGSYTSNVNKLHFYCTTDGTSATRIDLFANFFPEPLNWYHIALQRSENYLSLFVDGVEIAGKYIGTSAIWNASSSPLYIGTDTAISKQFYGQMDNIRITKGAARYTINGFSTPSQMLSSAVDDRFKELKVEFFNSCHSAAVMGNGRNEVIQSSAFTSLGDVYITDEDYKFYGTCLKVVKSAAAPSFIFEGGGYDYKSFLTDQDFTIECWFKTSVTATAMVIIDMLGMNSGTKNGWQLGMNSSGYVTFITTRGGTMTGTSATNNGAWHHCAITRAGNTMNLYVDGTRQTTATGAAYGFYSFDWVTPPSLGAQYHNTRNAALDYTGYIQDVRITKGVARYTAATHTLPGPIWGTPDAYSATYPVQMWPLCQESYRSTGMATEATVVRRITENVTPVTDSEGMYFNGNDARVSRLGWSGLFAGSSDFSIQLSIIRLGDSAAGGLVEQALLDFRTPKKPNELYLIVTGNDDPVYPSKLILKRGGSNLIVGTTLIELNKAYFLFISRKDGMIRLMVNGSIEGEIADTNNYNFGNWSQGGYSDIEVSRRSFNGYMWALTAFSTVVAWDANPMALNTSRDWAVLVDKYINGVTIPHEALRADLRDYHFKYNIWGLYPLNGNDNSTYFGDWSARMAGSLVSFGNVQTKVVAGSPYGTAAYFDGLSTSSSYYKTSHLVGYGDWTKILLDRDFTIEFWIFPSQTGAAATIFELQDDWPTSRNGGIRISQTAATPCKIQALIGGWNFTAWELTLTSTSNISAGAWYHVSLNRVNGIFTLYINGVSEATGIMATEPYIGATIWTHSNPFDIGALRTAWTTPYKGYMYDFTMVCVNALRNGNFTAPGPLIDTSNANVYTVYDPYLSKVQAMTRQNKYDYGSYYRLWPNSSYWNSGTTSHDDKVGEWHSMCNKITSANLYPVTGGSITGFLSYGTDDFTLEFYFKHCGDSFGSNTGYFMAIIEGRVSGTEWNSGYNLTIRVEMGSGRLSLAVGGKTVITGGGIRLNAWDHIAFVRYQGTYALFINGWLSQMSIKYDSPHHIMDWGHWLFKDAAATSYWNNGTYSSSNMDQVRSTRGLARYTWGRTWAANQRVVTPMIEFKGEIRDDTNALATRKVKIFDRDRDVFLDSIWTGGGVGDDFASKIACIGNFNERLYFEHPWQNIYTTDGVTSNYPTSFAKIDMSTSAYGAGHGSLAFDANGRGWLRTDWSPWWVIGTSDFTIEFWIKLTATPVTYTQAIMGPYSVLNGAYWSIRINTSRQIIFSNSSADSVASQTTTTALTLNTWQHVAVVFKYPNTAIYIDGAVASASTKTHTIRQHLSCPQYVIGSDASQSLLPNYCLKDAFLNGIRITKDARYTAAFTKPAAEPWATRFNWPVGEYNTYVPNGPNKLSIVAYDDEIGVAYDDLTKRNDIL